MKLMGIDVGFSKSRKTTGIACLNDDKLDVWRAGTSRDSRMAEIPVGFRADIIAVDGPVLPRDAHDLLRRRCESIFIYAPFSKRCKPGLSAFGFGLQLRRAAKTVVEDFNELLTLNGRIVEAFPNAFLAVLLSDKEFDAASKPKRRKRFDWLYELAVRIDAFKAALSKEVDLPDVFWHRMTTEKDHEKRAALVCLLTAAFAARGTAQKVGEAKGGWFWLPPLSLWQAWAKDGLSTATDRCKEKLRVEGAAQSWD